MNAQTRSGGAGTRIRWSICTCGSVYTDRHALTFGPRLQAFLAEPIAITVGTTRQDGSVQMVPVWFEYRDAQIWLNGGPTRDWFKHLQRDPRVTLYLLDPKGRSAG